jgi:tRNA1Val (adenine37-N6)-methyltransferase
MGDLTTDTFFNGKIKVFQSLSGYRFSIDAVIIANSVVLQPTERVCDIGTGCGIIPLVIAYRHPCTPAIYGIEIQRPLAEIAIENTAQNQMDHRIKIIYGDARTLTPEETKGPLNVLVCNPPHHDKHAGRINPDSQKALARHEITLNIDDLLATARRMLVPYGRLLVIYPASRTTDLLTRMRAGHIEPRKIRFVYTSPGRAAKRVIVEGILGGRQGAEISAPLFVNDASGDYTPEIKDMFSG